MRERLYLNHGWRYVPDYKPEYLKFDFSDATFKLVDIPHQINELPYTLPDASVYQHVACYRKMFILPSTMDNKRILLHFDGVMSCAAVFVNGKKVTAAKGGYTPFECDITPLIQNGDNLVTVVVDASEQEDTPPFGGLVPFLTGGGIYRSVWIEAAEQVYISKMTAYTVKSDNGWKISVNALAQGGNATDFKLYLFDGEEKIASQYCTATDNKLTYQWDIPVSVEEWSCESPKTYRFGVSLSNGDVIDRCIGFRTVSIGADGIYVNSKKVKLIGVNRYQSYPYVVCAMPASVQRHDARLIKDIGFNAVRCADGAASPEFLDECDKLGLLVLEEVSVCGYVGDSQWRDNLLLAAQSMMLRDICHPSVILWGLGDDTELAKVLNPGFHKLDPSRPTYSNCAVFSPDICDIAAKTALKGESDIPGHSFGKKTPFILTSYDADSISAAAFDSDILAGHFCEAFADRNTLVTYEKGDGIDHSGLFDMFRFPKSKAYFYKAQLTKEPFVHISENNSTGKIEVYSNCDDVLVYRNDKVIADLKADNKQNGFIKHPVMVLDDTCSNLLETEEGFDVKKADALKKLILRLPDEFRKTICDPKQMAVFEKKYAVDIRAAETLYEKYSDCFPGAVYTFEGIVDGKVACKCISTASKKIRLATEIVNNTPIHGETYDIAVIKLTATDENGNRAFGCNDAVTVETDGSIDIVGPRFFALVDGARAFYVRTKGGRGEAQIRINTENIGKQTIYLDIERMSQREINHARPHLN